MNGPLLGLGLSVLKTWEGKELVSPFHRKTMQPEGTS